MKTIRDIKDIQGKTFLIRTDYNVPIKNNKVTGDLRIRASLPTINYLREHGAKRIFIISHLGRPNGTTDSAFSLAPVAATLSSLIPNVVFIPDFTNFHPRPAPDGTVFLLENLRFHPGEKSDSQDFIQEILAVTQPDYYIQDAFAVLHRAHASTSAIKTLVPVYAGLLVEHEITNLNKVLSNPPHPLVLLLGGAKVADKQPLIDKFLPIADHILIGGKIAADGYTPTDPKIKVATDFDEDSTGTKLDIGPISTADFASVITDAKTVIWNGLLGYAEDPAYATSSTIMAELIGEHPHLLSIICGGDTTAFATHIAEEHPSLKYSLVSTGGGATLAYLSGNPLPGLPD